jgi:hypothetical protein
VTKKVFLRASPRAAEGIRRVYEEKGADVSVQLQSDGSIAVVVTIDEERNLGRGFLRRKMQGRSRVVAA